MTAGFVPFYRLNRHKLFPMVKRNKFAVSFQRFVRLVKDRRLPTARVQLEGLIEAWLGTPQALNYTHNLDNTFWLFDPDKCGVPIARARCFPSPERSSANDDWRPEARAALRAPARRLFAPPPEITRPGRCNLKRKPVFYGSYQENTCMAELRPSVGSCIVLAQFEITRPLKIFRLDAHIERVERLTFEEAPAFDLRHAAPDSPAYEKGSFHYHLDLWMGMPLLVPYSHPQYVARQLLANAFRNRLGCDGFEFTSSQIAGSNIVIFPDDDEHRRFPLRYITDSAERCWVTDRPVYAEDF